MMISPLQYVLGVSRMYFTTDMVTSAKSSEHFISPDELQYYVIFP